MKYYIISIFIYLISYLLARKKLSLANEVFMLKYGHDIITHNEVIIFSLMPILNVFMGMSLIALGLFTSYEKLYEILNDMMKEEIE